MIETRLFLLQAGFLNATVPFAVHTHTRARAKWSMLMQRLATAAVAALNHEIPHDQEQAQPARREEGVARRAGPLRRLLELFIAAAHVLRRVERVGHELIDVRRLGRQVVHQQRLELRNLDERLFRRSK